MPAQHGSPRRYRNPKNRRDWHIETQNETESVDDDYSDCSLCAETAEADVWYVVGMPVVAPTGASASVWSLGGAFLKITRNYSKLLKITQNYTVAPR